jgi:hypothetical protein
VNDYTWRSTPDEEWRTLQIAAVRAGCVVRSLGIRQTAFGPRVVGEVDCPDGWGAARMLLAAAIEDARSPGARDLALRLRREAPTDAEYARAVHRFIKDRVRFVREHGEVFTAPGYTLAAGAGDCDDHARAAIALALAGGIGAQLGLLHNGDGPAHAAPVLCVDGRCNWAETTVDAAFGEHPLRAAERLGLLKSRSDIAKEVVIMTEKNLAPVPADFVMKNPPAQVALDADALVKLGYLAALPGDPADPTNVDFRTALLAFQVAAGVTADGLIGPQSRAAILKALPTDHFEAEYARSIGDATGTTASGDPGPALSQSFFQGVVQMANDFRGKGAKITGLDFLAVWMGESGVNPHLKGHHPYDAETGPLSFGGLNMMGSAERKNVGFPGATLSEWVALSEDEQLPFVRRFYELNVASFCGGNYACLSSGTALELMNFLPAYMQHASDPTFVLAKSGSKVYDANPGFDVDKKGAIVVADLTRWTQRNAQGARWNNLAAQMRAAGDAPPSGMGLVGGGQIALLLLGVGGAVADALGKL